MRLLCYDQFQFQLAVNDQFWKLTGTFFCRPFPLKPRTASALFYLCIKNCVVYYSFTHFLYKTIFKTETISNIDLFRNRLKGLKRKMKGGIGWNLSENLRRWMIHLRLLSDVPVSRNWYKTVSNLYENSYICNFE